MTKSWKKHVMVGESGWYGGWWLSENASGGLTSDSDTQTKDTWGEISDKWCASWPVHGDHCLPIHSHGSQPKRQRNGWLWQMRICVIKVNFYMKENIIPSSLSCWLDSTDWQRTVRVCISLVQARIKSLKALNSQWHNLNRLATGLVPGKQSRQSPCSTGQWSWTRRQSQESQHQTWATWPGWLTREDMWQL